MIPRGRAFDESDVRLRPNSRGSRPRTKDRPAHADAVLGRVVGVDRGRYTVLVDGSTVHAVKARELGRRSLVVGDEARLVGDVTGNPDGLARIVGLSPRRSVLRRTADDVDPVERVIVANADQMVIVTALANPTPRARLIDRCLVAAYDGGLTPLLALTKADLSDPAGLLSTYQALDVPIVVSAIGPDGQVTGLDELREALAGKVSVLVGHSGVGKSTLVNALIPGAGRAIGVVNAVTGRGRHTSSSAVALALPDGSGWVVDTPGLRSFGLAHVNPARLLACFPDLAAGEAGCPRGCSHDEPDCALDAFVAAGGAGPSGSARLTSLRRLLSARGSAHGD